LRSIFEKSVMSDLIHTTIRVKGAMHYQAESAFTGGELLEGRSISLKPEPHNKYDSNAVAIYSCQNKMLGHIARNIAEKYQKLCLANQISSAQIVSAKRTDDFSKFDIRVSISYFVNASLQPISKKIVRTDETVTEKSGIYEISCGMGAVYIGASGNLRKRKRTHLANLLKNVHVNQLIQQDFNKVGEGVFKFRVLKLANSLKEAERYEAEEIKRRLLNGDALYNKTIDGRGLLVGASKGQKSISDTHRQGIQFGSKSNSSKPAASPKGNTSNVVKKHKVERAKIGIGASQTRTETAKLVLDDNAVYEGDVIGGKAHGRGKLTWNNGDSYIGQFNMNARTGKGVFFWADGKNYEGEFAEGEITGKGRFLWHNGDKLEGEFLKGRRLPGAKFTRGDRN
jgi:group I intron endonuclease